MIHRKKMHFVAGSLLAGMSVLLSGCFIAPGKFEAELLLVEEDEFTFTYDGEVHFLGLSSLAQMEAATETFEAEPCYEDGTFDRRECTAAELAEQRGEWEAGAQERAAEAEREAEQMAAIMGGINPSDPEASAELAALLERQRGWESVESKGEGLFDVSYSVTGALSHDFVFPLIEGFPLVTPFVQLHLRDGEMVRINAPGFSAQNETNPMAGLMGGMAGLAQMAAMEGENGEAADIPEIPVIDGTFTIVTKGEIRANNTDEGASRTARGQVLRWDISPRTTSSPTALIDMGG
ncbi:MAG: hypothetical protein WA985_09260 [Erythrobacter sp.]|uniref:hypothetical protein n=1 Tax=Erythrobacter sp. TaxID=1042 RepID=UPI003C7812E5